jgi:hypothetical protein
MKRATAILALGLLLTACGGQGAQEVRQGQDAREGSGTPDEQKGGKKTAQTLNDLLADPKAFNGTPVSVEASYHGSFERTVLVTGLTRSVPPKPTGTQVWVSAQPPSSCLQDDPKAGAAGVRWAHRVKVTGTFRHAPQADPGNPNPGRGFGHLGAFSMIIENAKVTCA